MAERSAEWWAGWQEAIDWACRAICRACASGVPIDPEHAGLYHKVDLPGGAWSLCWAKPIRENAACAVAEAERERQAASQIVGVIPRTSHLAAGFVVQLADGDGAAPTEAERQAALETRGWDGAEGGGDE